MASFKVAHSFLVPEWAPRWHGLVKVKRYGACNRMDWDSLVNFVWLVWRKLSIERFGLVCKDEHFPCRRIKPDQKPNLLQRNVKYAVAAVERIGRCFITTLQWLGVLSRVNIATAKDTENILVGLGKLLKKFFSLLVLLLLVIFQGWVWFKSTGIFARSWLMRKCQNDKRFVRRVSLALQALHFRQFVYA